MIDHAFTDGPDPICTDCGNPHVRRISSAAFARKVEGIAASADRVALLAFALRPYALAWTCDRCHGFGVSDFVDERDAYFRWTA